MSCPKCECRRIELVKVREVDGKTQSKMYTCEYCGNTWWIKFRENADKSPSKSDTSSVNSLLKDLF